MFILDAHLDLAMNAVEWNRDLTKSVQQIRKSESGMSDKPDSCLLYTSPSPRDS